MSPIAHGAQRRRHLLHRALPIAAVLAAAAFVGGVLLGSDEDSTAAAERFAEAWERRDLAVMHAELSPAAEREHPLESFTDLYRRAEATATATRLETGEVEEAGADAASFDAIVQTRAFGEVRAPVELRLAEGGIAWEPHLVFPGLAEGERLSRSTRAPDRAPLLARDGTPLAEGPAAARSSPLGPSALAIAGSVGTASPKRQDELYALGFPPGTLTGTSGLELALNERLAGTPGGELLAAADDRQQPDERTLARARPEPGKRVRTTIDPELQQATVEALGGLYGGVAVLDARRGDVLAIAGLGFSAPQPPGSTFKVVTTVAALEDEVVALDDEFPVEVSNSEIGREIANSDDAPCGGTFAQSFAKSCNTVFAPLGVRVGPRKLVETAEAFGFNSPPALLDRSAAPALDPPPSSLPEQLEGDVALGETAIGQGQVLATPLQMASVSQTIANGGRRMPTSLVRDADLRPEAEPVEVTSPEVAAKVRDLMIGVVNGGTGSAAALADVQVAGKTGTAELGPAALAPDEELALGEEPEQELDAWFTAFAPAAKPRLAVAVMIVNSSGDGGEVAAPIAAEVLDAGL